MSRVPYPSALFALLLAFGGLARIATAQALPTTTDDRTISFDEYLLALERIAPAARSGAEAYRQAYERRCGRPLDVNEMRRLVAEDSGDPVLMAMIGAAQRRDQGDLQRLGASIVCSQRK